MRGAFLFIMEPGSIGASSGSDTGAIGVELWAAAARARIYQEVITRGGMKCICVSEPK